MRDHHQSGGFIKMLVLILGAIVALWYFNVNVRAALGVDPETRYLYAWRANLDRAWYGFLVWYEDQTYSSRPLGWLQGVMERYVWGNPKVQETLTEVEASLGA